MTALLLAEENSGVLVRSFVIALILVAPVGAWQWRRIRARRSAAGAAGAGAVTGDGGTGGAQMGATAAGVQSDPRALESIVASIADLAAETASGEPAVLEIPQEATLDGRRAPEDIVAQVVRDALERGGFEVLAHRYPHDNGAGSIFECRRR